MMRSAIRISTFSFTMLMLIGLTAFMGHGSAARADVISAESEGYGIQVDLEVLNLLSVDLLSLTPAQRSAGTAPGPYSQTATAVPVNINAGTSVGPVLGTAVGLDLATIDGVLNSSADSDVDGNPGFRSADAFGQVNGLDLDVIDAAVTVLGIPTLSLDFLNLTAGTIYSTAMVSGEAGALAATGNSIIQDLVLEVNDVELDLAALLGVNGNIDVNGFLTAAPNTQLLSIGGIVGLDLILNQQIVTGDGISSRGIEVNAVRLTFNGIDLGLPLVSGALTGDIKIGHSQASMVAVPEPAALALLSSGLFLVTRRRTRNA